MSAIVLPSGVDLANDRGLLLGDGLFETALAIAGAPRFWDRHMARLRASAASIGLAIPAGLDAWIDEALPDLWSREGSPPKAALRLTVTRGAGRGLDPPAGPGRAVLSLDAMAGAPLAPARAHLAAWPRIDPADPLAGKKITSALGRVEARRVARARGADLALLASIDGDWVEADAYNLFAVIDGEVVTPPLDRGALPGITRARALAALPSLGCRASERRIVSSELWAASEVFVTSSLAGARAVTSIDEHAYQAPGAVTRALAALLHG